MDLLIDAKKLQRGIRVFETDKEGRSKLAEVLKQVAASGRGTVNYLGRDITVKRGLAALSTEPKR